MTELFKSEYLTVTVDPRGLVSMVWSAEEPSDDHAVQTAHAVTRALSGYADANPGRKVAAYIDLMPVKKNFPRAIAACAGWVKGHRERLTGAAFATRSLLLRASLSAAALIPGLSVKGFGKADDARRYAASLVPPSP